MFRIAHIIDSEIVNVSLRMTADVLTDGRMLEADALAAGYTYAVRPKSFSEVENYQVRAWIIRGGLDPDTVPQIISAVVPEVVPSGINRKEALMRWEKAVRVPRDFALVDVIGAQMGLTPAEIDAAWPAIALL